MRVSIEADASCLEAAMEALKEYMRHGHHLEDRSKNHFVGLTMKSGPAFMVWGYEGKLTVKQSEKE